jgi:hypothetical protein
MLWREAPGVPPRPANSIVALPFVNLSADHREDYIADGITEEPTNDLARLMLTIIGSARGNSPLGTADELRFPRFPDRAISIELAAHGSGQPTRLCR